MDSFVAVDEKSAGRLQTQPLAGLNGAGAAHFIDAAQRGDMHVETLCNAPKRITVLHNIEIRQGCRTTDGKLLTGVQYGMFTQPVPGSQLGHADVVTVCDSP